MRIRRSSEDMRERIVDVAEEHFRRIGYHKTAVADIASAMGMSPANIYRFFPSKGAINNAICARLMENVDQMMREIVERDCPPEEKLGAFFRDLHRHNKATLIDQHRLHDMVEVAMAENWPAIDAHCQSMMAFLAKIIAEGVNLGAFRTVDPAEFAQTAFEASAKIIHPTLIAQCAAQCSDCDQDDQVRRFTGLILAALRP